MRRFIFLSVLCLASISVLAQTEVCNDGLDNDNDGLIDCYDPDCANFSGCDGTFLGKDILCQAKPSQFPDFSMIQAYKAQEVNGTSRIGIGDVDSDGFPEIVTQNRYTKKVFIFDGRTGAKRAEATISCDEIQSEIAIADIDKDGLAEIYVYYKTGSNFFFDPYKITKTGTTLTLSKLWAAPVQTLADPVYMGLADFNGDGNVELYARDAIYNAKTGAVIIAGDATKWSGTLSQTNYSNSGSVAIDMDYDTSNPANKVSPEPDLELVVGLTIYDINIPANGTTGTRTEIKSKVGTNAYVFKNNFGATSIADFNKDGALDVIATGASYKGYSYKKSDGTTVTGTDYITTVFYWDVRNDILKSFSDPSGLDDNYKFGWKNGTGRINIGDLDGDENLDIAFVSGKYLYALDESWNLLWRKNVNEETSGYTGCTLFDFNGDGRSEVVYRDERKVYIVDAFDTSSDPGVGLDCVSRTDREYPVVADVNNDGQTEICVPCITGMTWADVEAEYLADKAAGKTTDANAVAYFSNQGKYLGSGANAKAGEIRVYVSNNQAWVPARQVWNQHGYFVVNVNDNLTIPARQQRHHLTFSNSGCVAGQMARRPLNSFLNQAPYLDSRGCPTYASPDLAYVQNSLTVTPPTCPDKDFQINFKLTNLGDLALNGDVNISYYKGDPRLSGTVKLGTIKETITNLKPGNEYLLNKTFTGPGGAFTLFVVLNDDGTQVPIPVPIKPTTSLLECNYDNNIVSITIDPNPVALTVTKISDNIKCAGSTTPNNGAAKASVNGNTTDYDFYWFNGTTVGAPASAFKTGPSVSQLASGTYAVFAVHKTVSCNTASASVTIDQVTNVIPAVSIDLIQAVTDCKIPNGHLKAVVNNGAAVGNFNYAWYEGNNIITDPKVGVNFEATGLKAVLYAVLVTDKATGCEALESLTVPDQTVKPTIDVTKIDITCTATTGSASASVTNTVVGNTYSFAWYNGSNVKAAADYTTAAINNLTVGSYTVVATNTTTKCISDPETVTLAQASKPIVSATALADQTSCDPVLPNGFISASITSSNPTTIQWFKGQSTAPADLIAGASSADLKDVASGAYTVKVTDNVSGCSVTDDATILSNVMTSLPTILGLASPQTKCNPFNGKASALLQNLGGTNAADYKFTWYSGNTVKPVSDFPTVTGNVLDQMVAGQYTVEAVNTKTHCKTAAAKTIVIQDKSPQISITLNSSITSYPTDCSSPTGIMAVDISAPGNATGFSVEWYKGRQPFSNPPFLTDPTSPPLIFTSTASNLNAGVYSATAHDPQSGCSATKTFNLPFVNAPELSLITQTNITQCSPDDNGGIEVEFTLNASAAAIFNESDIDIMVYRGNGDPGEIGQNIVPAGKTSSFVYITPDLTGQGVFVADTYTLVAVTHNSNPQFDGCRSNAVVVSLVQQTLNPVISASSIMPNTNCAGGTGNGQITALASYDAANYSTPVDTNGDGIPDGSVHDPQYDSAIKYNAAYYLSPPHSFTYDWFNGADVTASPDLANSDIYADLTSDLYTVRAVDNTTLCESTATFFIPENSSFLTIGAGFATTDLLSCDPSTGLVTENGAALISEVIEGTTPVTDLSNYYFTWTGPTGTFQEGVGVNSVSSLIAGNYAIDITNSITNCNTQMEFAILDMTASSISSVDLTSFILPEQCISPKDGSLTVLATGTDTNGNTITDYSYQWYYDNAGTNPIPSSFGGDTPSLTGLPFTADPTDYFVKVTINSGSSSGCGSPQLAMFTLPSIKNEVLINSSSSSPVTSCISENGVVFATVTNDTRDGVFPGTYFKDSYTYYWTKVSSTPNTPASSPASIPPAGVIGTGLELSNLGLGTYQVVVVDNNDPGCFTYAAANLEDGTIIPLVTTVQTAPLSNCDLTKANGTASASVGGDMINYTFDWYVGKNPDTAVVSPFYTGFEANNLLDQTYTVIAHDLVTGCVGETTITIGKELKETPNPQIAVQSNVTSCIEDNGALTASVNGNTAEYIFNWSTGDNPKATPDYTNVFSINQLSVGHYTVVAINRETGCVTGPDTDEIIADKLIPDFDFTIVPASCNAPNGSASIFITNNAVVESVEWDINGTTSFGGEVSEIFAGTYNVKVTTELGCSFTKPVTIGTDIHPYNGISRNNDGRNDLFYIDCIGNFPGNNVKIFNRAGTLVYEMNNYDNIDVYFDGKSNKGISPMGANLPDGTYFYVISKGDGSKPIAGYLELVN